MRLTGIGTPGGGRRAAAMLADGLVGLSARPRARGAYAGWGVGLGSWLLTRRVRGRICMEESRRTVTHSIRDLACVA
jgi:hypothetical protein